MNYRGLDLDRFQTDAIAALGEGKNVLVCAPTGTGKTIIADWIVDQSLADGRSVVYTAPIKALSNQKFRDYCGLHGEDRVGLVTGDLVIRREAPCRVMTTEVLRNMLLSGEDMSQLAAVVLDEIHFLDDRERGTVWEEVLIYLPPHVIIVGLSATLSNVEEFASWLEDVRDRTVEVVIETKRTVPLTFRVAHGQMELMSLDRWDRIAQRKAKRIASKNSGRDNRRRRGRPRRFTSHIDAVEAVMEGHLLPTLYFVFSRRDTENCAAGLARHLGKSLLDEERQARMDMALAEASIEMGPALDDHHRKLYARGIAFHHAGLHVQLKNLTERLYEQRLIDVLYCTSTFALGINMPARTVIFDSIEKYDGTGVNPLTTRGFMQKAGRAGRRGMDTEGFVILRMDVEDQAKFKPIIERYLTGEPEPVRSSFNLSFNSVVNLISSHGYEGVRPIIEASFLNWHLQDQADAHEANEPLGDVTGRERKKIRRMRARAARNRDRCWNDFQAKVGYLINLGYLDEDFGFRAGAKILSHIQIAEIFVTELELEGILEPLPPSRLFGLLCAVTNSLPRHARTNHRPDKDDKRLVREVERIRFGKRVEAAEEISGASSSWDPGLLALGRAWAEGTELQEVLMMVSCETDLSGDMINGFRRAKDLIKQLRQAVADDPHRLAELTALQRTVSRDEVEVVG